MLNSKEYIQLNSSFLGDFLARFIARVYLFYITYLFPSGKLEGGEPSNLKRPRSDSSASEQSQSKKLKTEHNPSPVSGPGLAAQSLRLKKSKIFFGRGGNELSPESVMLTSSFFPPGLINLIKAGFIRLSKNIA